MLFIGLLLSFFLGLSIVTAINPRLSIIGKIGFSFIVGIGVQTVIMVILDILRIPLTVTSISIASLLFFTAALVFCYKYRNEITESFKSEFKENFKIKHYTILWIILLGIIAYLEFLNFEKCLYFPTFDRDSLVGFDFMGRVIGKEHCMGASSYFQDNIMAGNKGANYANYTPLVHLSYAYAYIYGAASSKIINALVYLSFLISFYAVMRYKLVPTLAMFATLMTLLVPEYIAFSSMSATNMIFASYASLAILCAWLYFDNKSKNFLILTILFSALTIWTRQEGIIFVGAITVTMLIKSIRSRSYKNTIIYLLSSMSLFAFWFIYLKSYNMGSQSDSMRLLPFWDSAKASTIYTMLKDLLTNTTYYSLTFTMFAIALIISLYFIIKSKKGYELPFMSIIALFFLCILLYQVEYNWDSLENVMQYSVKRILFCFAPLAWAFVFSNPLSMKVNKWME